MKESLLVRCLMEFICSTKDFGNYLDGVIHRLQVSSTMAFLSQESMLLAGLPKEMRDRCDDHVVGEIKDIEACVRYKLWTPAVVMGFRLFEDSVRVMAEDDFGVKEKGVPLHQVIGQIASKAPKDLKKTMQALGNIRKQRNKAMHGADRYTAEEAITIVWQCLWVVLFVYALDTEK